MTADRVCACCGRVVPVDGGQERAAALEAERAALVARVLELEAEVARLERLQAIRDLARRQWFDY